MGAIEPCIYRVPATKTKPAGVRVQKFVRDQYGEERKVSRVFRPDDGSDEAFCETMAEARKFRDEIDGKKVKMPSGRPVFEMELEKGDEAPKTAPIEVFHGKLQELVNKRAHGDTDYFRYLLKQNVDTGEGDDPPVTFAEYINNDYLPWIKRRNSSSDYQQKQAVWTLVKAYCKQTGCGIQDLPAAAIEPKHIDGFVEFLEGRENNNGKPYSKSTVVRYFKVLKSMVRNFSKEQGVPNPADSEKLRTKPRRIKGKAKTPKVPALDELKALDEGFLNRILEAKEKPALKRYLPRRMASYYMHRVLLYTGLRPSELFYLELSHFDEETKTLMIEGGAVDGEPGYTKTGKAHQDKHAGQKIIPALPPVVEAISAWVDKRAGLGFPDIDDCPIIFCDEDGDYFRDDSLRTHYKKASKAGGLNKALTPYQMRHGFNDRLRRFGVPVELRQALMGHLSSEVNMNYTDVDPMELRDHMEDLNGAFAL